MKKIAFLALALSLTLGLFAQHNEEVTIEGTYRPKVNKVDKILLKPETPEQVFTMPEAKVDVLDIEHSFRIEMDKLNPLNYNAGKGFGENSAKNFVLAGFGSRITPVFLFKHNSNLTRNLGLGIGLKHYSSWLDIKEYAPSSFMNNAVEIGLTSNGDSDMKLGFNVYYKNDTYHYYGIKLADWTGSEQLLLHAAPSQMYNTVGAHLGLVSTNTRLGEYTHNLGVDYHYLFGRVGNGREHFASLDYDLGFVNGWWGQKSSSQKLGVVLGAQYGYNEFVEQQGTSRLLVKVNPYFEMKDDFYRLRLGAKVDAATKFKSTEGLVKVYPDVKGSLFVLNKALEFYAGLNGGRKLFSYSDLIEENPFLASNLNFEVTNVKLGFDGGIRTNIMNTLDVHLGVRYRHTDNDPFYRQRINPAYEGMTMDRPYNSFDLVYDETRLVSVLGNIRWLALDMLTVDAGFTYNNCDPENEEHAWYRPVTEGNLKLNFQLTDALSLNANFLYQGGRWGLQAGHSGMAAESVKLKDVYDLGLGAEYKIRDRFTVFVKADNLLNRKYQLYLDYPVTGIEAFVGLKMAF